MTNQNSQDCYDLSVQESVLRIEYEISGCPWYHSELFIWNFCAGTKKSCQNGKNKFEEKKTICYKSHPCRPIFQFHFNRISHSHIYIWKVSTNCLNQWQAQLPKHKNVRFETDHCETEFEFISMLGKWHLNWNSLRLQIKFDCRECIVFQFDCSTVDHSRNFVVLNAEAMCIQFIYKTEG